MQSKISLKWLLVIVGITGIAIFFLTFDRPGQGSYTKPASATDIEIPRQSDARLPVNLKIPKIYVDATVEHVGLTSAGAMGVPKGPANVAWFNLGPRPGEKGSAVIAGHYGWKNSIPAAFDDLDKLKKGDKIYVVGDDGAITTFVVRESRTYDQNEDAPEVFGSSDGKAHLNLITCEGLWNKAQKSYSNRLVVFTDKE